MMLSEPTPFTHSFNFNTSNIHPLSSSDIDDVTTIFVVGFPEDMTEREFQNMFTFCHGFEAASLKMHFKDQEDEKKQMIGFARFRTRLEALEVIEILNGKKIDQEKGIILKAEMAKKNLHIKKPTSPLKKFDTFSPLPSDLFYNNLRSNSFDQDLLNFISFSNTTTNNNQHPIFNDTPRLSLNLIDQNPPCNTLYVGNLPLNTSEDELRKLFSNCKGYRRMYFKQKLQGPMCFVEFENILFASKVLNELQGHLLSSSIKGGIRLSFSKNPLFIKPTKQLSAFDPQLQ